MKKEWADKWIAALRSGNYLQGRGSLMQLNRSEPDAVPSFCCLGVLCDIAKAEPEVKGHWDSKFFRTACGHDELGYRQDSALIPPAVQKATGMLTDWGQFRTAEGDEQLTNLNDKAGKSFEEIAQVIEKHWEQL